MIELYTIGFTGKTAEHFFGLLRESGIKRIVDTRRNNNSQLAAFTKAGDLPFFAREIGGMDYWHNLDFAPAQEMLARYRKREISWEEYSQAYLNQLDMHKVARNTHIEALHRNCLLCSEHSPEHCHRQLLAEYLQAARNDLKIIHLL